MRLIAAEGAPESVVIAVKAQHPPGFAYLKQSIDREFQVNATLASGDGPGPRIKESAFRVA
jgi:hypothetical protein